MIRAKACRLRGDEGACRAYVSVQLGDMTINGIRIVERPDGTVYPQLPQQRDHTGAWFPVIELSPELALAVKAEAMVAYWRV